MAKEAPFIGQMDRLIEVYKTEMVPDELSTPVPTDVLVAKPWAKRVDVSGSQEVEGGVISVLNRSYIIWRNPQIANNGLTMHIVDKGLRFDIITIREIERSHLELTVKHHE